MWSKLISELNPSKCLTFKMLLKIEARRAVKMEEDENVCWADLEGQPHKPSHMKAEPFNVVVKWQKVEQERAD